jgi:hypothetical protein
MQKKSNYKLKSFRNQHMHYIFISKPIAPTYVYKQQ